MLSPLRATALILGGLVTASLLLAQLAISTHSGLVQITLGDVFIDDRPVHKTPTVMLEMKLGQVMRTGAEGNAEVLLTPGVFLRVGNNSSIRMDGNALSDTRLTLLSGSAMLECDELLAGNAVSITVGNQPVQLRKRGLFRLQADPPAVAAIKGETYVGGTFNATVKQGKMMQLDGAAPLIAKYKTNKKEPLYVFSKARSEDSVYATGVTANTLLANGFAGNCTGSNWYLMGGVGMYSFVPCNGMMGSPFGSYFLGVNSAYLWAGPTFYTAPYGLYGGGLYNPVIGRGYRPPAQGTTGGTVAGGSPTKPNMPPTFGRPDLNHHPIDTARGLRSGQSIQNMAGPNLGRGHGWGNGPRAWSTGGMAGPAMGTGIPDASQGHAGGGYAGGMHSGAGPGAYHHSASGGGLSNGGGMSRGGGGTGSGGAGNGGARSVGGGRAGK